MVAPVIKTQEIGTLEFRLGPFAEVIIPKSFRRIYFVARPAGRKAGYHGKDTRYWVSQEFLHGPRGWLLIFFRLN